VNRLLDLIADDEDRPLAVTPQPEMPVVEEKVDAVLFRLNRVIDRARADDCEVRRTDLVAARRPRVCFHFARHRDGGLGGEVGEGCPDLWRDL
jgi:hypothetical protein